MEPRDDGGWLKDEDHDDDSLFVHMPLELVETVLLRTACVIFQSLKRSTAVPYRNVMSTSLTVLGTVSNAWYWTIIGWPQSTTGRWFLHQIRRHLANFVRSRQPRVTQVLRAPVEFGDSVGATALLDDRLFVARQMPSGVERFVAVYNTRTMALERRIFVPGLGHSSFGIVAIRSESGDRIFLSDFHNSLVHRLIIEPQYDAAPQSSERVEIQRRAANDDGGRRFDPSATTQTWPVASHPVGLSATRSGHLLVACGWADVIQLYDADSGRLVRETPFTLRDRRSPEYAIEIPPISDGGGGGDDDVLYAVSHNGPVNGVCVVRAVDGVPVFCFGRSTGNVGRTGPTLREPRGLVFVARSRCLLVADKGNNRLVVIDPTLKRAKVLPLRLHDQNECGIDEPQALCLDSGLGRLFIGEFGGMSRLIVVDNINNVEINV